MRRILTLRNCERARREGSTDITRGGKHSRLPGYWTMKIEPPILTLALPRRFSVSSLKFKPVVNV